MQHYEYRVVSIFGLRTKTTKILNELGADGWELVAVWAVWHYLKRPKTS
jgi:hypothetical protein